jgi:ABC-type Fe3+/spermidine/putrescine transport system ATPase subunit
MIPVTVEGVRKRYGQVEALRDVTLEFEAGRLSAILGPSGCGKTTLLRSIAGFVSVDAGAIRFAGEDVTGTPPQGRGTAMVFQNYALWPHMTVFDNVAYGLRLRRVAAAEVRRRVLDALALVEIGDVEAISRRKPGALSGGQQQRVALARALVVEPRVLLLDEPLSNLDAKVRQRLRVEVRRLQRRVGITTIYVTHDQEEALAIADRVVLLHAGRVVQVGAPEDIYRRPASVFAADFLGVGTRFEGRVEAGALHVAGHRLPYGGLARGAVVVVVRSSDVALEPRGTTGDGSALAGHVEERLFLGAFYRHYVRVGDTLLMADSPEPVGEGPVTVRIAQDRVRVYEDTER